MVRELYLANNFLKRAFKSVNLKEKITPMKLQKLLYLTYKHYLKSTNSPLFSERFEVWAYGPVLGTIYRQFKKYGGESIDAYYVDEDHSIYTIDEESDGILSAAINYVWENYSEYTGPELSCLTHQPDTAWHKADARNDYTLDDNEIQVERWYIIARGE
ncbi:MAG: DUF4065 domain-containing protein [Clostridiales bacterium]|jgi:uncharacterized phage-associated protein|nr:DUF4065 domain-containing protein [Clostridiales bacterium]